MRQFAGVGVALITPFNDDKTIDFASLEALVDKCCREGADYLVVLGTTAEAATLTACEKKEVVAACKKANNGRLPLVLGIGSNNTCALIEELKNTDIEGFSAILSVTPYYNKPNQRGLYEHYKALVEATPLPIILYNVPGRTGINLSAETTLKLAHEFPKTFIAIKEASGNLGQIAYIVRDRPANFAVISGDDNLTLPSMALGADGVISVSANCFTKTFCDMIHLCQKGDFTAAAPLNLKLHEATDLLFAEGNPVGAKAALAIKGEVKNNLRLPLVNSSPELYNQMKEQIEKHKI